MYKSKLQNLCQIRKWPLPEYTPLKDGPDHNPRFTATVTVNGAIFSAAELGCTTKEAQNNAAKAAFDQLTRAAHVATPPADPHVGFCIGEPSTQMNGSLSQFKDSKKFIDSAHLYKNRLQNYALKKKLTLPAYSCEREGPPHVPCFRCKVMFQGKTVESSEFYSTIKEAEHAAAKIAWESLDDVQQDDTSLYKNLLQECLQKTGCPDLKYETTTSGPSHMPIFVSKINIGGHVYEGQAALSKKQAESQAAKVAYFSLQDQDLKEAEESNISSGLHIGGHLDFGSGSGIKEALEISSSILQSVIAKDGDLPSKVTPNGNLLNPAEISEEYADSTDEVPHSFQKKVPHSSPETDNSAKRLCLPSSDLFDFDSSAFSSINTNNSHQQVGSTNAKNTTNETIVVRPRVPNMTFSAGASVLPFSNDKWVAVKMNSKH